ncbi:transmembrane protein 151B [Caerostris extrusa]|uniref:Transmembrane protein 151B n=1 Tax=Caerostris extrusa TaxID=172846 RepID=A0AAV4Q794_CAEEX|nr:transmembrane protein 151B [Caerostris extrusa]
MIGHMSRGTTIDSSNSNARSSTTTLSPPATRVSSPAVLQFLHGAQPNSNPADSHINSNNNNNNSSSSTETTLAPNRSSRRFSTTGIPVSISRSSLQNGRVVYYVSPLEDTNNENNSSNRRTTDATPEDNTGNNPDVPSVPPPPSYDDALRHCRPLFLPLMRRSVTDRDIQRRLPLVFVHQSHQRDTLPLGDHIEENEPESAQTSL